MQAEIRDHCDLLELNGDNSEIVSQLPPLIGSFLSEKLKLDEIERKGLIFLASIRDAQKGLEVQNLEGEIQALRKNVADLEAEIAFDRKALLLTERLRDRVKECWLLLRTNRLLKNWRGDGPNPFTIAFDPHALWSKFYARVTSRPLKRGRGQLRIAAKRQLKRKFSDSRN